MSNPPNQESQNNAELPLVSKLNLETAQIQWRELQTFFASGSVIFVGDSLDMLNVAEQLVADNTEQFSAWLEQGKVAPVSDQQALDWYDRDATVWGVVIKPWVLVQERN